MLSFGSLHYLVGWILYKSFNLAFCMWIDRCYLPPHQSGGQLVLYSRLLFWLVDSMQKIDKTRHWALSYNLFQIAWAYVSWKESLLLLLPTYPYPIGNNFSSTIMNWNESPFLLTPHIIPYYLFVLYEIQFK